MLEERRESLEAFWREQLAGCQPLELEGIQPTSSSEGEEVRNAAVSLDGFLDRPVHELCAERGWQGKGRRVGDAVNGAAALWAPLDVRAVLGPREEALRLCDGHRDADKVPAVAYDGTHRVDAGAFEPGVDGAERARVWGDHALDRAGGEVPPVVRGVARISISPERALEPSHAVGVLFDGDVEVEAVLRRGGRPARPARVGAGALGRQKEKEEEEEVIHVWPVICSLPSSLGSILT